VFDVGDGLAARLSVSFPVLREAGAAARSAREDSDSRRGEPTRSSHGKLERILAAALREAGGMGRGRAMPLAFSATRRCRWGLPRGEGCQSQNARG